MKEYIQLHENQFEQYQKAEAPERRRTTLILESPAKINLYLDVLGKLQSGYHEIVTLFSEINLCDILKFSLTNYHDIKLLSTNDSLVNSQNLIYQTAIYIQAKYSVRYGAKITLEKNIPIAAGLGGGSSNAATTIRALDVLWDLNMSEKEKNDIAARFGSDINFFINGGQAIGTGRGEKIETIPEKNFADIENILLVNPNFHISSNEAYKIVTPKVTPISEQKSNTTNHPDKNLKMLLEKKNIKLCFNRLEKGIEKKYPIIAETLEKLKNCGAKNAILSGSGPTMIGFFSDTETLEDAQKLMKEKGFWTFKTTTRRRQKK